MRQCSGMSPTTEGPAVRWLRPGSLPARKRFHRQKDQQTDHDQREYRATDEATRRDSALALQSAKTRPGSLTSAPSLEAFRLRSGWYGTRPPRPGTARIGFVYVQADHPVLRLQLTRAVVAEALGQAAVPTSSARLRMTLNSPPGLRAFAHVCRQAHLSQCAGMCPDGA